MRFSSRVFSIVSTKFHLDRGRPFFYEFSVEKFVILSFREYLGDIESAKKDEKKRVSRILFCCACARLCRGRRFHFSSPNS